MATPKSSSWDESERKNAAVARPKFRPALSPSQALGRVAQVSRGGISTSFTTTLQKSDQTLEEAFPVVDPNYEPMGSLVLLQVRIAQRTVGDSKIELPDEAVQTIQANTTVAKVVAHGPLAFKNRSTGQTWPEGAWVKPGDFVRVPRIAAGGDRFEVPYGDGVVQFIVMKDLELSGRIPRPLDAIAYV